MFLGGSAAASERGVQGDTPRTTSQENIDALRQAHDAVKQNDPAVLNALLDPEIVWVAASGLASLDLAGTYRGIGEVQSFFASFEQALEAWGWEHEEMRTAGDHVITLQRIWGRGRHSGIELEDRIWQVWTFRDGKVIRYQDFSTRDEAFEAAGPED